MTKRKDYMTPIVMGTIWTLVVLAMSCGSWWVIKVATNDNTFIATIFFIAAFLFGMYKGRDFFKVEMIKVTKRDPQTNWLGFIENIQLVLLTMMFVNVVNVFNDGFSWSGFGAFICGSLFVLIMLYIKNTRYPK